MGPLDEPQADRPSAPASADSYSSLTALVLRHGWRALPVRGGSGGADDAVGIAPDDNRF